MNVWLSMELTSVLWLFH